MKKVIKTLLIASGVVLFWRGTWGLMDLYIYPEDPFKSFMASTLAGIAILALTHHFFDELT